MTADTPSTSHYMYQFNDDDIARIKEVRSGDPAAWARMVDGVRQHYSTWYDDLKARYLDLPNVLPDRPEAISLENFTGHDVTDRLAARMLEVGMSHPDTGIAALLNKQGAPLPKSDQGMIERAMTVRVLTQMLLVTAEIRRYEWEHYHLPATLDDLAASKTTIDAFSGKPFLYALTDKRHYTLNSVGPHQSRIDGGASERQTLSLTDERKRLVP